MSGLQEITAIFAVVELGVKSLSAVYNLIQTLRHIPNRIEQAKHEVKDILNCLAGLQFIQTADSGTIHAIDRAGLEASVSSCREACDELRGLLSTWDPLQSSITAKLKYFRHRKAFDGLLNDITNRKQNTTLALVITQLSVQVSSQQATISHSKSLERFLAHCYPCHRNAEQNNPDMTSHSQCENGGDLEVARPQPGYVRATDDQSSPSTDISPQSAYGESSELHNRVAPWAGRDGTAFAEHEITDTEGRMDKWHGGHVFEKTVHASVFQKVTKVLQKAAQVFKKGAYIEGGEDNQIGMPQSVAEDIVKSNYCGTLQMFNDEVKIVGSTSRRNRIGIFKD